MSERARDLAQRLRRFYGEVETFVTRCSPAEWKKVCPWEDWTVGVTARHIAAGHLDIPGLVQTLVRGDPLPPLTEADLTAAANRHAAEHAECTPAEVVAVLREKGPALADYVAELSDAELGRTGRLEMIGDAVSAERLVELVVLDSGGEHLAHMRDAVAA